MDPNTAPSRESVSTFAQYKAAADIEIVKCRLIAGNHDVSSFSMISPSGLFPNLCSAVSRRTVGRREPLAQRNWPGDSCQGQSTVASPPHKLRLLTSYD